MSDMSREGSVADTDWHLAQVNVGRMLAPKGDSRVAPFFDALDRVNTLAEASPGFVWRLQDESGNATDIKPTSDPLFRRSNRFRLRVLAF